MNNKKIPRNLLPHALPLQINPPAPYPLNIHLVLPPIQRERDIEQLVPGG